MSLSTNAKNRLGHIFATAAGLAIPMTVGTLGIDTDFGGMRLAAGAVIATTLLGSLHIMAKADPAKCLNFMCCAAISMGLFMDSTYAPPQDTVKAPVIMPSVRPANSLTL